MIPNIDIARATAGIGRAQRRVGQLEQRLVEARQGLEDLRRQKEPHAAAAADGEPEAVAALGELNAALVLAALRVEDLETARAQGLAAVAAAETAEGRIRDAALADRLERAGAELATAAAEIDSAMAALVEKFERHRQVLASIGTLAPRLTRDLMYRHQHRLPARAAAQHHGLSPKFVPLVRSAFGSSLFSAGGVPAELVREVERLRGGPEEVAA